MAENAAQMEKIGIAMRSRKSSHLDDMIKGAQQAQRQLEKELLLRQVDGIGTGFYIAIKEEVEAYCGRVAEGLMQKDLDRTLLYDVVENINFKKIGPGEVVITILEKTEKLRNIIQGIVERRLGATENRGTHTYRVKGTLYTICMSREWTIKMQQTERGWEVEWGSPGANQHRLFIEAGPGSIRAKKRSSRKMRSNPV